MLGNNYATNESDSLSKPNSAVLQNRHSTLPINEENGENPIRPIPQIDLLGAGVAMNSQIRDEIAARDALLGIDEEEHHEHHHDFSDDEVS